jgi:hypothetical protein
MRAAAFWRCGMLLTKMTIGASVFAAILCGQPDLLTVLCLYLWVAVAIVAGIIHAGQPASAPHRRRPSPVE